MNAEDFKNRTMKFGLAVIDLVEALPKKLTSDVLGRQLIRAAVSVGANYRAACRAKSPADFIHKMGTVEEEVDEAAYWLELMQQRSLASLSVLKPLQAEADEITAMVVASIRTAKGNRPR